MSDLYDLLAAALPAAEMGHHESDLYVKITPEARAIIETHASETERNNMTAFVSKEADGATSYWWELPFCYTSSWRRKTG